MRKSVSVAAIVLAFAIIAALTFFTGHYGGRVSLLNDSGFAFAGNRAYLLQSAIQLIDRGHAEEAKAMLLLMAEGELEVARKYQKSNVRLRSLELDSDLDDQLIRIENWIKSEKRLNLVGSENPTSHPQPESPTIPSPD